MEGQKIPQILGFVINGKIGVFFASPKHTSAWKTFRARSARNEARLTRMWWSCRLEADRVFAAMGWSSRNCPPSKGISRLVLAPSACQDVTIDSASSFYDIRPWWGSQSLWSFKVMFIQAKPMLSVRSQFLATEAWDVFPGIGTSPLHHHGEAALKLSGRDKISTMLSKLYAAGSHSCTIQHRFLILKKIIIFPLPYFPTSLPSRTAQVLRLTDSLASHSLARWVSAADVPQLGVRWFHQGILSLAMCALQGLHCDSRLRTDAESIFLSSPALKNWKPLGLKKPFFLVGSPARKNLKTRVL